MEDSKAIKTCLEFIKRDLAELKATMNDVRDNYVSRREFNDVVSPMKSLVYGMVSTILLCVIGAVMALVVRASP